MAIFEEVAGNKSQPIAGDYASAAQVIDLECGPNFVNTSIPTAMGASGKSGAHRNDVSLALGVLAVAAVGWTQQLI